jgi:hypothetical protein
MPADVLAQRDFRCARVVLATCVVLLTPFIMWRQVYLLTVHAATQVKLLDISEAGAEDVTWYICTESLQSVDEKAYLVLPRNDGKQARCMADLCLPNPGLRRMCSVVEASVQGRRMSLLRPSAQPLGGDTSDLCC